MIDNTKKLKYKAVCVSECKIVAVFMHVTVMSNRSGMKSGVARRPDVGYRDRDHIRVFDRRERRKRSRSPIRRRSRSLRRSHSKSRSRSRSKSPQHSRHSRSGRYNVQVPKITMDL